MDDRAPQIQRRHHHFSFAPYRPRRPRCHRDAWETVGAKSVDALKAETLPARSGKAAALDLGKPLSETEAIAHMASWRARIRSSPR